MKGSYEGVFRTLHSFLKCFHQWTHQPITKAYWLFYPGRQLVKRNPLWCPNGCRYVIGVMGWWAPAATAPAIKGDGNRDAPPH